MVGAIHSGKFDSSIAGFAAFSQRKEALDFTAGVVSIRGGLFTARDLSVTHITTLAYTSEFSSLAWALYSVSAFVCLAAFWLVRYGHSRKVADSAKAALDVTFRSLLSMGGRWPGFSPLSWRMAMFSVFAAQFLILANYKSAMNAFLAIKVKI